MKFNIPTGENKKLAAIVKLVERDKELETFLHCANVTAIDRLGYSDHGPTHVKIVANIGLRMLRLLMKRGIEPSIAKNHDMKAEDAEIVVVLASLLHDIGMIIHRENHDQYGLMIATRFLDRYLHHYGVEQRAIMTSEILHAMAFHDSPVKPLTVEGGVVRIADGLDMAEGRARIPFSAGKVDIHSVSALAIKNVEIREGKPNEEPIQILIRMNNSAGIFQVDNLLKAKVMQSGLYDQVNITAVIEGAEKKIISKYQL
jgi:metal-dependent HD superfamily phosphatase/phosphodiesterase